MSRIPRVGICLLAGMLLLADCVVRPGAKHVMLHSTAVGTPYALRAPATAVMHPVRLVGRFVQEDAKHIRVGWPNSGIGARFTGTSLRVALGDREPRQLNGHPVSNAFDIYIDQLPGTPLALRPGVTIYSVAENLSAGEHTIWLSKRTEGMVGSSTFMGFIPESGGALLTPPPPRQRRLSFIGASNETGYGDMAEVTAKSMCAYSPETQNADIAYPKLVADVLGADLTNISYAGRGVYQNADANDDPNETIPGLFRRADPLDLTVPWTATEPAPQVIVVDLGGNDFFSQIPDEAGFVAAYSSFLQGLRRAAPQAEIFCLMGPTMWGQERTTMRAYVQDVVEQRHRSGDAHVSYFEFAQYHGAQLGCDFHPDSALQQAMAAALQAAIRAKMGW